MTLSECWWYVSRHFHRRRLPVVLIDHSGQRAAHPKVHVLVAGPNGTQGVYTYDADDQG
jgi:hypothetical protein